VAFYGCEDYQQIPFFQTTGKNGQKCPKLEEKLSFDLLFLTLQYWLKLSDFG